MPQSFQLKRFTNAAILRRIDFQLLVRFFESNTDFQRFLERRGMRWTRDPLRFDYNKLAHILISPGADTPDRLLDALYFVDNLANADCYDRILEECQEAGIDLGSGDPSPEDLTLLAWLAAPSILERVHAEQYRSKPKKFTSYFALAVDHLDVPFLSDELLQGLEEDLDTWYEFKKKGRGARVFPFVREDGIWFLIRHGQRIRREGTIARDGESASVFYRPEKFDVLILYPETGELAINTDTKGECKAYCTFLGQHLFGDERFFAFHDPLAKYTLQPLIDVGRSALACRDIDGLQSIKLIELHMERDSEQENTLVYRSCDVFTALEYEGRTLAESVHAITLRRAKFRIVFTGGRTRTASIVPPNVATFDRESDSAIVHEWLSRRGFICSTQEHHLNAGSESVLAPA